ncbi:DUF1330 domain-containing protein [Actinomadura sp. 3N508]|uniref:DUF1330 domain-containing protein n=1 Tax=Actinomadura sp. 3N508 TaxID=3375153 RepID=UPI00378A9152
MAKGYWVSVYPAISDPERLSANDKLAGLAVQAEGGRVLSLLPSRGGRIVAQEAGITQRVVLIEFDSFEQAVAAYESEVYQEALVASPTAWSATSASSKASTDRRAQPRRTRL